MRITGFSNSLANINRINQFNKVSQVSMNRLTTGKRINSAADGPSDIIRINKLNALIRGNRTAQRNIQESISMLQVKENSLNEMNLIGQRLRELAVSYKSNVLSKDEREAIEYETTELIADMQKIKEETVFNGHKLFSDKKFRLQTGENAKDADCIKDKNIVNTTLKINQETIIEKTVKHELNEHNINAFIKKYGVESAKSVRQTNPDIMGMQFHFTTKCSGKCGHHKPYNAEFNIQKKNDSENVYNLTGSIFNGRAKIDGIARYDKHNKIFSLDYNYYGSLRCDFTFENINRLEDLEQQSQYNVYDKVSHNNIKKHHHSIVNVNRFEVEKESNEINVDQFVQKIKQGSGNNEIFIDFDGKQDMTVKIMDGKAIYETTEKEVVKSTSFDKILNSDYIDRHILQPINKERSYIGIKTKTLENKLRFQESKEQVQSQSLSRIEDVDMAKEVLEMTKNQMLSQVALNMFTKELDNRRTYIAMLLN